MRGINLRVVLGKSIGAADRYCAPPSCRVSYAVGKRWGRPTAAAPWYGSRFDSLQLNAVQLRSFRVALGGRANNKIQTKKGEKQQYTENEKQKRNKRNKLRMRNLHKAAKMKRILCACDYWFSRGNLVNDEFLKEELRDYMGHVPISTLATFPKLEHWGDDLELIYDTLTCEAAKKRYKVVFNRQVKVVVERNRRRKHIRQRKELFNYLLSKEKDMESEEANVAKELRLALQKKEPIDEFQAEDCENDEELPLPIVDDGSSNFAFALVRPKKVKPEDYAVTPYTALTEDQDEDKDIELDTTSDEEEESNLDKSKESSDGSAPSRKAKRLKKYSSARQVYVIKNAKQLASFCNKLNSLADRSGSDDTAIGFDVEYCRLEDDIRDTLPAMLMLASSDPNGIVGLVWLDKFPNHGKDIISDHDCEELLSLLGNSSISKVGVGATKDVLHLAAWWGINDREFISHYFSGIVDLEHAMDDVKLVGKSLQELCEAVLEQNLPKIKERNARKNKRMRINGRRVKTSHWRRDELTKDMKRYAADDSSSAIDIWNKMQEYC